MVPSRAPQPLNWQTPLRLRKRIARAISLPFLVGASLFVVAVAVAVWMVLLQPHTSALAGSGGEVWASEDAGSRAAGLGGAKSTPEVDAQPTVFVHIVGEVHGPGVVELREGARVEEAIAAAGGATEHAVLAGVNLARRVIDGEQIHIPDATHVGNNSAETGVVNSSEPGGDGIVNINLANAAALDTLPGVGPALAERIIEWRTANGSFSSVDQLLEVSGIGVQTLERLRDRARV